MSQISARQRRCVIMTLWMIHRVPVIDHGSKILWVTLLRFSLFQNRPQCRSKSTNISDHGQTGEKLTSSRDGIFQSARTI